MALRRVRDHHHVRRLLLAPLPLLRRQRPHDCSGYWCGYHPKLQGFARIGGFAYAMMLPVSAPLLPAALYVGVLVISSSTASTYFFFENTANYDNDVLHPSKITVVLSFRVTSLAEIYRKFI